MRLAISRPSSTEQEALEVFRLAKEYGYDAVQAKRGQFEFCENLEEFEAFYGNLSYLIQGGIVSYPGGDITTWDEKVRKDIAFTAEAGGEHVTICATIPRHDTEQKHFDRLARLLNSLGEYAREKGTELSMHNHSDSMVEGEEDIEKLCVKLEPELCGLTIDTGHASRAGIADIPGLIWELEPYINNIHLKDATETGVFCPLGTGIIDLESILNKLEEIEYNCWLVIDEESKDISHKEAFAVSMEYIRNFFD